MGLSDESIKELKKEIDNRITKIHPWCTCGIPLPKSDLVWVKELIESYVETEAVLADKELMAQIEESKKNPNVRDAEEVFKELGV